MSVFDDFNGIGQTGPACVVPTCPAGKVGGWNYLFPDGPCLATDCGWPEGYARRPHFTDNPATPIEDAGAAALKWFKERDG